MTLSYFATGSSYRELAYTFRVPYNTISTFLIDVCHAIVSEYGDEVVKMPDDEEEWPVVIDKFNTRWNFPNTIRAIDGKALKAPPNSGTVYHNYKGFFSIILLALVDTDYKFLWVELGAQSDIVLISQSSSQNWRTGPLAFHLPQHLRVTTHLSTPS